MNDQKLQTSGRRLLDGFGSLYVINLPSRTDRHREFGQQLMQLGLSYASSGINLFPAVRPDDPGGFPTLGARGCFMSHLGVLTTAAANNVSSIIVCEDDLDFAQDFHNRLVKVLSEADQQDWDILYLGHDGLKDRPPGPDGAALIRLTSEFPVRTTHFLVFRQNVYVDLIAYLQAILRRPPGHPDGGPMHVDGAFSRFRADHPQLVTLAAIPPLGYQRPSRTDIHALRLYDRLPFVCSLVNLFRRLKTKGHYEK
ncbi:MAG: glycosyltransferase family 25 protein [Cypionkella sp.]